MTPQTFSEWVTLGSLIIAFCALVFNTAKNSRADTERDQAMRDRLDQIKETTEESKKLLRDMNQKLDDHGTRIARLEERTNTLFHRVERVESDKQE